MQAISVKELRQSFPFIKSELNKGQSFLIIHKSKPIARLEPFKANTLLAMDDEMKIWESAAVADINKHLPPTTKDEYDYYMSVMKPI